MNIQYASAVAGGFGALGSPTPPGSLSINTTNQNLPGGYVPGRPGPNGSTFG